MDKLQTYIKQHASLFWYTPENKKNSISKNLLVEIILNYGTMDDVKELFQIMGIKEVSKIFYSATGRQKSNYYPEIYNFFNHVFMRYAQ